MLDQVDLESFGENSEKIISEHSPKKVALKIFQSLEKYKIL
jgi:hypothetical protein